MDTTLNVIIVAKVPYNLRHGFWFNLVLTTRPTGFSLAHLCQLFFLVWSASMVWSQNLVVCTPLNNPHTKNDSEMNCLATSILRHGLHRAILFLLPRHIFTALSVLSRIPWILLNNVLVNQLLGVYCGLRMSVLVFP